MNLKTINLLLLLLTNVLFCQQTEIIFKEDFQNVIFENGLNNTINFPNNWQNYNNLIISSDTQGGKNKFIAIYNIAENVPFSVNTPVFTIKQNTKLMFKVAPSSNLENSGVFNIKIVTKDLKESIIKSFNYNELKLRTNTFTSTENPTEEYIKEVDLSDYQGQEVRIQLESISPRKYSSIFVDDIIISTTNILSTSEVQKSNLRIFPNPSTEQINIQSNKGFKAYKILTIDGKIVTQKNYISEKIPVNYLEKGTYILLLIDNEGKILSEKFIKK